MADMQIDMNELMAALRAAGAEKLAWTLEQHADDTGTHWTGMLQAANDMGAPVQLAPDVEHKVREAVRSGQLGGRQLGSWVLDCQTGAVGRPQPRPGDGAGAPGITERSM